MTSLTAATSSYLTSLPSGTISGSTQITSVITDTYISASAAASGFLSTLPSGTISGSAQVETIIDDTYISASAALSGFLSSLPSGVISGSTQITSVITDTYISASAAASGFGSGGGVSTDISSLNTFSGSIQTEVTSLTQATASYLDNTNTILVEQSTPTAEAGGIYYSGSNFFVGID